jgi:hypothetical protein
MRSEILKLRRTRALWLALGAPLSVGVLFALLVASGGISFEDTTWTRSVQGMVGLWGMLMLPLYVALETALINAIDHEAGGWTHLFALPVPRWCLHAAKLLVAVVLAGLSTGLLTGALLAVAAGCKAVGVGTGGGAVPWHPAVWSSLYSYGGALGLVSIHHGLSLRLSGFEWPLGVGIAATVFATQVGRSKYWFALPWSYPTVAASSSNPEWRLYAVLLSATLAVVVGLVTAYDAARRDVG